MTRPLTDWPAEATHRAGQVPDRLIERLALRTESETVASTAEARQREAETLARIDAQFARTRGRFADQRQAWDFLGGFLGLCLVAAAVFMLGIVGAAFWG